MQKILKFRNFKVINSHINTILRNSKIHYKSSDLFSILREHFGKNMNLARNNSIAHLIADREFVGSDWLAFLNSSGIHYHIRIRENFLVNGQPCYLSGSKIKDKEGKPELKILVSYCNAEESRRLARQNPGTYGQSICIVMIAYFWCYLVGIHIHENIKAIKVLNHGRKAKSLFKYGLDYISQCLLNNRNLYQINIFKFLSYT